MKNKLLKGNGLMFLSMGTLTLFLSAYLVSNSTFNPNVGAHKLDEIGTPRPLVTVSPTPKSVINGYKNKMKPGVVVTPNPYKPGY